MKNKIWCKNYWYLLFLKELNPYHCIFAKPRQFFRLMHSYIPNDITQHHKQTYFKQMINQDLLKLS